MPQLSKTLIERGVLVAVLSLFLILVISRTIFVFAETAVVNAEKREYLVDALGIDRA